MGDLFRLHISSLSEPARRRVLASQRAWLAFWPRACSKSTRQVVLDDDAVECARGHYEKRIAELQPLAPGAGLQAYVVSQYRYVAPTDPEAPAGTHQSAYPQVEAIAGRVAPRWLGALNAFLDRAGAYGPDKDADADSTSEVSLSVSHIGREVVQFVESAEFYGLGAAHGLTGLTYHHFLTESARPLRAEDVFTGPRWQRALAQKVLEALREEAGEDLLVSDVKEIVKLIDPSHWDLQGPGLQVHFNPYEVAPYARGFVSVRLTADDLRDHLTDLGKRILAGAEPLASTDEAGPAQGARPDGTVIEARARRPADGDEALDWVWPAEGKVIGHFDARQGVEGLSITGLAGAPVRVAADGRVVYAGAGLRGYGNMVIVKHNETYLTAYAHNRALLVKEGQVVRRGQQIAEMGDSESDKVQLHFEVRRLGKPVDPMGVLPVRR
jgi:murein DD-endopeptidase MepM/ murein hydrolase activator NlpD